MCTHAVTSRVPGVKRSFRKASSRPRLDRVECVCWSIGLSDSMTSEWVVRLQRSSSQGCVWLAHREPQVHAIVVKAEPAVSMCSSDRIDVVRPWLQLASFVPPAEDRGCSQLFLLKNDSFRELSLESCHNRNEFHIQHHQPQPDMNPAD
ncbi:unnamed protein product [Protopolystoma xenopodis]|uniref:Uncharacterized protein n=1 Tax=Protopolystoma xenopodis TaxID=117903 RepID=A0A3S5B2D8_9PLAT|nr:unnamed protein product [Protopolystoma xenopodis]